MKRTGSIDYVKFLFSLIILLYHFGILFYSGYIVVEGFFMITGYLMMSSLCRVQEVGNTKGGSSLAFTLRKYRAVAFPLLFSALTGFVVYEALIYRHPPLFSLQRLPLLLFEVIPLQMTGLEGMWTTGVSWYLSSMLLGILLLHPLVKRNPMGFGGTAAPCIALLGYGLLSHHFGHLDVPNLWILNLVNSGLIRGIAGLCGGFTLYYLVHRLRPRSLRIRGRLLLSAAELGVWALLILTIMQPREERILSDFILTAAIFLILLLILSERTLFSLLPSGRISRALATVSTFVYLNHYPWSVYLSLTYPHKTPWERLPVYLLCVALSSGLAFGLTTLAELWIRKHRERLVSA